MAGLIAAHYFRNHKPYIIERQKSIPDNHSAVLRFRTDAVSRIVGIPFRQITVRKAIVHDQHFLDGPNPYAANQYSLKVANAILDRSVWNVDAATRYVAPGDFTKQMVNGLNNIELGNSAAIKTILDKNRKEPVISTIPMPALMDMVSWKDKPTFGYMPIWVITGDIIMPEVNVNQTIYFTSLDVPEYRASLVGNHIIIECCSEPCEEGGELSVIHQVLDFFGIPMATASVENVRMRRQQYGKITPIDDSPRKEFMYTMTREYNVYSLGRFATWKQILLDDVCHDLEVISSMITSEQKRSLYHQNLLIARKETKV